MSEIAGASLERLIRPEGFECGCGRHHSARIRYLRIGPGVVELVPEALFTLSAHHPMVICDPNGYKVAGKMVCSLLEGKEIRYSLHVVPSEDGRKIKPAELSAGSILLNFNQECDIVLGVGSGVINDLCKVLSKTAKLPYMIVATAPSMDGYASDSASVEIGNIKFSLKEQMPAGILCDTDIMAKAPMHMIHAGLGDMLAKYTALCDWKVSSIVTGEYYCDAVARLVKGSLLKTINVASGVGKRGEYSIRTITEGLVLSGMGIAFAGSSHPASGLEHYFSHCWEMMRLECGETCELHGIQVGVGMLLTLKIIERLKTVRPDMAHAEAAADRFDPDAWEQNLRRVFPRSADGLLKIEKHSRKNERAGRIRRATRIIAVWDELLDLFENTLPSYAEAEALMLSIGMPVKPREIGYTADEVADSFVCSRDIRDKYLISSLIWDIGYMDEFAEWLRAGEQ